MYSKLLTVPISIIAHLNRNMGRYTLGLLATSVGLRLLDSLFHKYFRNWAFHPEDEEFWYDCIFMTDKGLRGAELLPANKLVPVTKPIVDFVDSAQSTLDICFYVITANNVVEAILKAQRRKVMVRVIVDYNTGLLNNEHTRKFLKAGIQVHAMKTNQNASIMHHKFCICDGKILLQASMNLTQNTAKGSFDNILLLNDKKLVKDFQHLFDDLIVRFAWVLNENILKNTVDIDRDLNGNAIHRQKRNGNAIHRRERNGNAIHRQERNGNAVHRQERNRKAMHRQEHNGNTIHRQERNVNKSNQPEFAINSIKKTKRQDLHGNVNISKAAKGTIGERNITKLTEDANRACKIIKSTKDSEEAKGERSIVKATKAIEEANWGRNIIKATKVYDEATGGCNILKTIQVSVEANGERNIVNGGRNIDDALKVNEETNRKCNIVKVNKEANQDSIIKTRKISEEANGGRNSIMVYNAMENNTDSTELDDIATLDNIVTPKMQKKRVSWA